MSFLLALLMFSDIEFKQDILLITNGEKDLQSPGDIVQDARGQFHVLDIEQYCVFVWNENGKMKTTYGNKGQGPGEFEFSDLTAHLTVTPQNIVVVDDRRRQIQFWSYDHEYEYTKEKPNGLGRIEEIQTIGENRFIIYHRNARSRVAQLLITDFELNILKVVVDETTQNFTPNENGGWTFRPYSPRILVSYNYSKLLTARTDIAQVNILGKDGTHIDKVRAPLSPPEISKEDKKVYIKTFRKYYTSKDRLILPKYDSTLDIIIPLENDLYIMAQQTFAQQVRGVVVNKHSERVGSIDHTFEEGTIDIMEDGRLGVYNFNSLGEYVIRIVRPVFNPPQIISANR